MPVLEKGLAQPVVILGEKNTVAFLYCSKPITIILGGAKPQMQQQYPHRIVLGGNCCDNAILLLPVDHRAYLVHSNPYQSLTTHVHLQGGSQSIFALECFWRFKYLPAAIVSAVSGSWLRCSYSHGLQGFHLVVSYHDQRGQ